MKDKMKNTDMQDELQENDVLDNNNTLEQTNSDNITEQPQPVENITDKLQQEIQEQKDKYLRLFAEFDNFKKRTAKERLELIQTAGKDIVVSLLPVLDDCDRADKQLQTSNDVEQIKQGVQLVFNKLKTTLQAKGLKPMESINNIFDVEKHEAITEIPAPLEEMKDKVIDEIEKGYYLNDKLIRFAKVVVGK